jgi:hypothetical protein
MSAGVDATHPATDDLIRLATQLLRGPPAFFGRYFKGPHNPNPIQYQAGVENQVLSAHNIPVLCIARQTNRVGGSNADGVADAVNNMSAVITSFGADYLAGLGFEPLIFLDTELGDNQPSLSADYFHGWADALRNQGPIGGGVQLKFTPAIYINRSDAKAWRALATAISNGAMCRGAWVANYGRRTGVEGPPAWDPAQAGPKPPVSAPCPILAWQYAGDFEDVLDFTVLPADSSGDDTVHLFIPPPSVAPTAVAFGIALSPSAQPPAGSFTVRHGRRYRATITLTGFEQLASNGMIEGKLEAVGFTNVSVTGAGGMRQIEGTWNGPDTTAQIDPHLSNIQDITPAMA